MWIMAEMISEQSLFFDDTSYIEMLFQRNGISLEETRGKEAFSFQGLVLPGKRLSGTGRSRRHSMDSLSGGIGLGVLEAPPGSPMFFGLDTQDDLRLKVNTNLVLDVGLFAKMFSLNLWVDGVALDIPLSRPDVEIDWTGRGEYSISLEPFILEALRRRILR